MAARAAVSGVLVGVGLDSVDVPRFARILARRPAMAARLFTDHERSYADRLADPTPSLAARFAAKEATMKALGVGLGAFGWDDVEVERMTGGAPTLVVRGRAAELAAKRGVGGWHVSMTHTDTTASAVVVAVS
jgi:holo-[acyl-carrier protein] synthase